MAKPAWCPHAECSWVCGGGTTQDSGVVCCGRLPAPTDHDGTPNTHRLCIRTSDGDLWDGQVNRTDVWYLTKVASGFLQKIDAETTQQEQSKTSRVLKNHKDDRIQKLTEALQRIADYDKKPRLSYFERTMTMIARAALGDL